MGVVLPGWVLFRAADLPQAGLIFRRLAGEEARLVAADLPRLIEQAGPFLLLGLVLALACPNTRQLAERYCPSARWFILTGALLFVSLVFILANLKQPEFLYFNF
jgi:hypothetical protein